jgi:F-type H+-transporting ATPase subunit b
MVDISITWTLIAQIVNILLLMVALNFLLYKPVRRILGERQAFFDSLRHVADTAKLRIEEGEATHERHRAEMVAAGSAVLDKFKDEGRGRERDLLAQAHEEGGRLTAEARTRLGGELEAARAQLRLDSESLAREMVGMVLGRDPGPAS